MLAGPVTVVRNTMPVVTALRSPHLTENHWNEIKQILRADFNISDSQFTLESMIGLNVGEY